MNTETPQILFVDDEEHNLFAFNSAFRRHYQIHLAISAKEGLEILKKHPIEVIVTDQRMPEMTGVEFLEKIIPEYPDITRMVLTGYIDMEAIIQAINKGHIYQYISKPWEKQEFKISIDNAVEAYRLKKHNRQLITKLLEANQTLEEKVRQRTEELHEKNKNITDSIHYAQRMQSAMLPRLDEVQKLLPESFVLFKPRDIVSGDFYWLSEIEARPSFEKKLNYKNSELIFQEFSPAKIILAAADCTGHGVPGAMMSMIANNLLNEIINEKNITETAETLRLLHEGIVKNLKQNHTENRDGLDIALCVINPENSLLEFAGAKNPLYFIRNGSLEVIAGSKNPIGGIWKERIQTVFTSISIPFQKNDCFYICSDGFQDQFGGEKKTKFMRKHFRQLLSDIHLKTMNEQKEILENTLENWKSDYEQTDDILVMGFRM